jgi:hypothetical protein
VPDPEAPVRGSVYVCIRPEHILVVREGREARDASDVIVETELVDEFTTAGNHRLFMRAPAVDRGVAEPFVFEVDVPAHPYEVLGIAGRRDWRIALTANHLALIPHD